MMLYVNAPCRLQPTLVGIDNIHTGTFVFGLFSPISTRLVFFFFCNDAFFMLNLKESDFGISTSSIPHTFSNNRKPVVKKNDPVQMGLCGWKCTKYVHKESTAYICQLSHRLS